MSRTSGRMLASSENHGLGVLILTSTWWSDRTWRLSGVSWRLFESVVVNATSWFWSSLYVPGMALSEIGTAEIFPSVTYCWNCEYEICCLEADENHWLKATSASTTNAIRIHGVRRVRGASGPGPPSLPGRRGGILSLSGM